ncbi:MAG: glycosyltransferase family A protein [Tabrizicola sp.]|uniref:glycosyltransferase family A protein n=1 Tax=Tabrizicola sp. TaxID=2005166 RepID=UPI002736CE98|nr:glycosyltransferase family A protein [Tabrizicola sp.]MDP3262308.1 glycosyltransferase family A protein [Tabrizicola sp.]MDP3647945.1 glycosyltransferase family A protein [Paracoccaceae bacterium]MDZ4069957.1 glycosyltransferase family A protein [Tabrizicola sp.]
MTDIVIACASHSETIRKTNIERSPLLAQGIPLHVEQNAPSASVAYNRALDATTAELVVFAHHDVYLPQGWQTVLRARIAELPEDWAVFGTFGIGLDAATVGPVWSSSLGMIVGRVPMAPVRIQSLDELLIVVRRSANLRFDEALPGWHMYGTDIVQTALAAGRGAYAGALPCIHNDRYHDALGRDFDEAYHFMQRKWADVLPLRTPITKISRSGLHLMRDHWRNRKSSAYRTTMAVGTDHDVERLAERCGWSHLG